MTFLRLKDACGDFRALLSRSTGRDLILTISVDEPEEPLNELHFFKLVTWCYVLLFEASQPTARYLLSLLRTANPTNYGIVRSTLDLVNNLRTVRVHNLLPQSKSDDRKQRLAKIWMTKIGGDTGDWERCCDALCDEVEFAIRLLSDRWRELIDKVEDAAAAVEELKATIDREWPAHHFDRIVEAVVSEIGLRGFDCAKYRENRLDRWRELVSFFEGREHAEIAMKAAITNELRQLFLAL